MNPRVLPVLLALLFARTLAAPLCTGATLTGLEAQLQLTRMAHGLVVPPPACGRYALVDSAQLSDMMGDAFVFYRRIGLPFSIAAGTTGWTDRFNCVDFTRAFLLAAVLRHDREAAGQVSHPAIFPIAYRQDRRSGISIGQRAIENWHKVMLVLTDRGVRFVDPVSGPVVLSADELATIYWTAD